MALSASAALPSGSHIIGWRARVGLHRPTQVILVMLLLAVFLWAAGALDHTPVLADPRLLWRPYFMPIALIPFALLGYIPVRRAIVAAEDALSRVVALPDAQQAERRAEALKVDLRIGWIVTLGFAGLGAVGALLLVWSPFGVWLRVYALLSYALMTGLVGRVLFETLALHGYFAALQRPPLDFDLFHPAPFEPLARFSLLLSVLLMGGVALCIPFAAEPQAALYLVSSLTFGVTIVVALVFFFLNLLGIHRAMSEAKERALARVRSTLSATYEELSRRIDERRWDEVPGARETLQALLAYEKRIQEAPEWPYTSVALRRLVASALLPIIVWAVDLVVRVKF